MNHIVLTKNLLDKSTLFYLVAANTDGNYSYVNENYAKDFLPINGEFLELPFHITIHPDDREKYSEVSTICLENPNKLFPLIIRKLTADGIYIYTHWEFGVLYDKEGNLDELQGIGHNLTQYIEEQMKWKKIDKETTSFSQSQLSWAPPSSLIKLAIELLEKRMLNIEATSPFEIIHNNIKHLNEILDNIVTVPVN
jgi:hypothetical protein